MGRKQYGRHGMICGLALDLLYCKRQDKRWFIKTRRLHVIRMHCDTGYLCFPNMGYANMEFGDGGDGGDGGGSGRGKRVC